MSAVKSAILNLLAHVPDPEIPVVSVVDLGIVREVREVGDLTVVITPTYTGCPATAVIEANIRKALDDGGFANAKLQTELSPPWSTDWISEEARLKLKAYGIDPPASAHSRDVVACPRCGSAKTEMISRFGSTPCKALHRCLDCLEPFDKFKCH